MSRLLTFPVATKIRKLRAFLRREKVVCNALKDRLSLKYRSLSPIKIIQSFDAVLEEISSDTKNRYPKRTTEFLEMGVDIIKTFEQYLGQWPLTFRVPTTILQKGPK